MLLVRCDPLSILRMLVESKESLEGIGIGEAQLGESVIIKVRLGAHEDGRWEVGIALGVLRFPLCAVDIPPGMAQREVPGSPE